MITPLPFLRQLFDRAVEVADPMRSLKDALPPKPAGRVVVVGAGKASARMAEAVVAVEDPCAVGDRRGQVPPQQSRDGDPRVVEDRQATTHVRKDFGMVIPAAIINGHEGNADLNETTGQQKPLSEGVPPVKVAGLFRFCVNVERLLGAG